METLGWVLIGLLAGTVSCFILPGRDPGGGVVAILLGIAGALFAAYLGRLAGLYGPGEGPAFLAALFGSIAILVLYRLSAHRL